MGSDQEYMDFLNKANQDVGGGSSKPTQQSVDTSSVNTSIPNNLEGVQEYYVSDADEPFKPVALKYSGSDAVPSLDDFTKLTQTKGRVTSIDQKDFDPQGQYSKIVELVKSAGSGEVAFFKVELDSTRLEYYIVSVADGKIVGLKAKAVES